MRKQICKNCNYYLAYYRQWSAGFGRLNNGYCSKHEKHQTQFECCDDFKSNEKKEARRETMRMLALEQALAFINEIAQILKEKEAEVRTDG